MKKIPLVLFVRSHSICLASSIWINQCYRDEIRVRDGMCVSDCQRILDDLADWAPDVDYLVPRLQKSGGQLWQMVRHTAGSSRI